MKKVTKNLAVASFAAAAMFIAAPASAIPSLQLDIQGGAYDTQTQTIVTTNNSFSLFAYMQGLSLTDKYYVSVALEPMTSTAGNYGSFTVNGATVNVTGGMVYGTPPLEGNQAFDSGDLSKHGEFPTYFTERQFTFSSSSQSGLYNTADNAGSGPIAGSGMYYRKFDFNISNLVAGYGLHFDLYNEKVRNGDVDVNSFAPFSHDAEATKVSEPGTLALLLSGLGFLLFGFAKRRGFAQAA